MHPKTAGNLLFIASNHEDLLEQVDENGEDEIE